MFNHVPCFLAASLVLTAGEEGEGEGEGEGAHQ
jgi:hypothetical protein